MSGQEAAAEVRAAHAADNARRGYDCPGCSGTGRTEHADMPDGSTRAMTCLTCDGSGRAPGAGQEADRFRCPACGHWCRWVDDAWVCARRGGCGAEYTPDGPAEDAQDVSGQEAAAEVLGSHQPISVLQVFRGFVCACEAVVPMDEMHQHQAAALAAAGLLTGERPEMRTEWGWTMPGGIVVDSEERCREMVARYADVPNGGAPGLVQHEVSEWREVGA